MQKGGTKPPFDLFSKLFAENSSENISGFILERVENVTGLSARMGFVKQAFGMKFRDDLADVKILKVDAFEHFGHLSNVKIAKI